MSEFFLELFSEEIPSNLQQNLREDLLKSFNDLFLEKSILFKSAELELKLYCLWALNGTTL